MRIQVLNRGIIEGCENFKENKDGTFEADVSFENGCRILISNIGKLISPERVVTQVAGPNATVIDKVFVALQRDAVEAPDGRFDTMSRAELLALCEKEGLTIDKHWKNERLIKELELFVKE